MVSGVKVSEECIYEFNKLKVKHQHKYIIFRIENCEEIIVDLLEQDPDLRCFEDIIINIRNCLKKTECRYIIAG
ncbi:actin depolymerizing factor [Plasmodium ovale wallikeri]|uniref:Actin depolymerizing factor n=1 Tax=Plasmodium ovale wallikeri TaxID=864142 RepID=A0A1A8YZ49_PLAOA|nr:actin depolymerizing factor [Plasmodium ovale wallikeri]SBT37679.1 actin depolymerizing factor [Plasmodium ovale wallikeri]